MQGGSCIMFMNETFIVSSVSLYLIDSDYWRYCYHLYVTIVNSVPVLTLLLRT